MPGLHKCFNGEYRGIKDHVKRTYPGRKDDAKICPGEDEERQMWRQEGIQFQTWSGISEVSKALWVGYV